MADMIATCPECGGEIIETQKGYGCSNWKEENGGCKFVIWKNFYDKKITKTMAKTLIEKGKTNKIKGWVSRKTGNVFEAALKLEKDDSDTYKVSFDFDN